MVQRIHRHAVHNIKQLFEATHVAPDGYKTKHTQTRKFAKKHRQHRLTETSLVQRMLGCTDRHTGSRCKSKFLWGNLQEREHRGEAGLAHYNHFSNC